jgi:uncharacterized protein (DUF58 family)
MPHSIDHNCITQFGSLEFLARHVVEGFITGLHKSPFHGFSVEFAEHRLYNPGESTRYIDWKLYGRIEKMFVKRFEEETNLRCKLVIDQSSSMRFPVRKKYDIEHPNKALFSVYAAASLIELMRRQRDAVGLSLFDEKIDLFLPARSSQVHLKSLYLHLEKLLDQNLKPENRHTSTAACLHQIAELAHHRSLVIIFSDMLDNQSKVDETYTALQHLRYNKHEVVLFHVFDRLHEEKLEFENSPHRFVDLESGEEIKLNPALIQKNYFEQMQRIRKDLMLRCAQYKIDYVEADINQGFNQVLLSYLIKRSRLY